MNNYVNETTTQINDGAQTFFHLFSILLSSVVGSSASTDLRLDWSLIVLFVVGASVLLYLLFKKHRASVEESVSDVFTDSEW